MVYESVRALDFLIEDVESLPAPGNVLMTSPEHFEVSYVINPHMAGNIGTVDPIAARSQWNTLRDSYAALGINVHVVDGIRGLPDMVFCANQTLPFFLSKEDSLRRGVILSQMYATERMREVARYNLFFFELGYEVVPLQTPADTSFEGMGDAIWHPSRYLLWGGYGFRTDPEVYRMISDELDVRVLLIELKDPDFYHLDTCFSVLNEETVLIYPGAFQPEGLALVRALFRTVIEAPEDESRSLFACNAHCPDGKHVIIQTGCTTTNSLLRNAGFSPVEVDTSEFLKAGGSVFCMKQMFW
jgi:N-dimethylarginine dimethylaminohydrolase